MSQGKGNETVVLLASLLVTGGLLGGGAWWLAQRGMLPGLGSGSPPTANTPAPNPAPNNGTAPESSPTPETGGSPPSGNPAIASPVADFGAVPNVPSGLFQYGGSTTWAPIRLTVDPVLQAERPEFRLRYADPVGKAPGSGSGIEMLLEGQLVFSQSSRPLKDEEYDRARQRGFELQAVPVALDGIAIAVNPTLAVPGLTVDQLRAIYLGEIDNWSVVGGPDLPIVPYARPVEAGGTIEFFVENVLGGEDFGDRVVILPTTTQALRAVAQDPGGLYFASAPEVVPQCTVKTLPVGREADRLAPPYAEPAVPLSACPGRRNAVNVQAFQSGDYPLTRRLFAIVKQDGQIDQQAGEAYAALLLTDRGQALVAEAGFVPIR